MLAAHRAGLKTVILPNRNEKDLEDLPQEVRASMKFILVEKVDQVFEAALTPAVKSSRNGHAATRATSAKAKSSRKK
jgi:ATP-dependent Lon protease